MKIEQCKTLALLVMGAILGFVGGELIRDIVVVAPAVAVDWGSPVQRTLDGKEPIQTPSQRYAGKSIAREVENFPDSLQWELIVPPDPQPFDENGKPLSYDVDRMSYRKRPVWRFKGAFRVGMENYEL